MYINIFNNMIYFISCFIHSCFPKVCQKRVALCFGIFGLSLLRFKCSKIFIGNILGNRSSNNFVAFVTKSIFSQFFFHLTGRSINKFKKREYRIFKQLQKQVCSLVMFKVQCRLKSNQEFQGYYALMKNGANSELQGSFCILYMFSLF